MKLWFDLLMIAGGGALGAMSRFLIAEASGAWFKGEFPLGTFIANMAGCFLIGVLIGSGKSESSKALRMSVGIGFLGALTTFSTFGAETIKAIEDGAVMVGVTNVIANLIFGLLAVVCGLWLGRKLV